MHLYVKADYCLNELEVYSQILYKSRIDEMSIPQFSDFRKMLYSHPSR